MLEMRADWRGSVISGTLSQVVGNVATIVTTLVALFSMSWILAWVGLAVLPLLIAPTRIAGKSRLKYATKTQAKTDEMNQIINETLSASGSLLVKMFTREEKAEEEFRAVNGQVRDLSMKETRSGSLFRVAMGMFTQLGPLLIYFAGGLIIIEHYDPTLTVGIVTAMVSLVNRLYCPVESLLDLQVTFTRSLALFVRIFDYLDRDNPIVSPEDGKRPDVERQPIVYEHVAFGYEEGQRILADVSFTVPGGAMYAIVGPSGSGKSTVVNLIPRLYDVQAGSVKIAGVDVRDFDLEYLRRRIGVVTQEAYLFNGTILENLRYADENATVEDIERACRIANIHEFIQSQPDGYDTQVGNRGLKLSGGEKQRLSLARVVLKDPQILILDEATSALDSISENAIQSALEELMVGRTSIVIAHRLSTILKADCILVVKDGVIAEQGTHEELLAAGGVYRELYDTQFKQAIERSRHETGALDIQSLGTGYDVRRLSEGDISDVFALMRGNRRYWRALGVHPKRSRLTEVISQAPEGVGDEGQYLLGFYGDDGELVAVLDLITGYPASNGAFIGWFMVEADLQGRGIGSDIFADVRASMKAQGYDHMEVRCPKASEPGVEFWESQGFAVTAEIEGERYPVLRMERDI